MYLTKEGLNSANLIQLHSSHIVLICELRVPRCHLSSAFWEDFYKFGEPRNSTDRKYSYKCSTLDLVMTIFRWFFVDQMLKILEYMQ